MLFSLLKEEKENNNIMFTNAIGSDFITNKKLSTLMNKHIKLQPKLTDKKTKKKSQKNKNFQLLKINGKKATKQMEN